MLLQTIIPIAPEQNQLDYQSKVLLLGSCFSENIGSQLDYFKFRNLQNPFGIIFNPVSISKLIARAINEIHFSEDDIFEKEGIFHCFEIHSLVSGTDKSAYLEDLNSKLFQLKKYLEEASHIVFTFGTAWVYRWMETSEIVANCHKVPQREFEKELLSISDISAALEEMVKAIQEINPRAQVINTVSPVRHIKDGFVENAISKSHLIAAIHQSSNAQSSYFPSYEIMMDELRDYRFYQPDLVHPNKTAITIIWERFRQVWIDSKTETLQKEIDVIQKGLAHKPFHPESTSHVAFLEQLQQKISSVKEKLPFAKFESK